LNASGILNPLSLSIYERIYLATSGSSSSSDVSLDYADDYASTLCLLIWNVEAVLRVQTLAIEINKMACLM